MLSRIAVDALFVAESKVMMIPVPSEVYVAPRGRGTFGGATKRVINKQNDEDLKMMHTLTSQGYNDDRERRVEVRIAALRRHRHDKAT